MVPALVLKARLAVFAHRPDVAKSCLITAITADPTSEEAQFFLGLFYYMQNDFKLAISPLQTAQTLSPKSPLPVFYLAMTQEALGDATQALDLYPHYELAKGLDHEGDFKNAALEGEQALTLPAFGTSDAQIHFLLANVYLKLKQPDLAKAHLEKFQAAPQTTRR
jgi:tetratricopeptide (TPR) repeat protein